MFFNRTKQVRGVVSTYLNAEIIECKFDGDEDNSDDESTISDDESSDEESSSDENIIQTTINNSNNNNNNSNNNNNNNKEKQTTWTLSTQSKNQYDHSKYIYMPSSILCVKCKDLRSTLINGNDLDVCSFLVCIFGQKMSNIPTNSRYICPILNKQIPSSSQEYRSNTKSDKNEEFVFQTFVSYVTYNMITGLTM